MNEENFYEELNIIEKIAFNNGYYYTGIKSMLLKRQEKDSRYPFLLS